MSDQIRERLDEHEASVLFPPPLDYEAGLTYPLEALRDHKRAAFIAGAAWQRKELDKQISDMPEQFRDPEKLARFVIENEWALDSQTNPSGRADWRETLQRVYDSWDADTPDDIVSTIAAAIRFDRHFRTAPEGDDHGRQ